MDIAIVGFPQSGKTTVFNAMTRGAAQVAAYGSQSKPNLGVAKVPDPRLNVLEAIYKPKRTVLAEVTYIDVPPPPAGFGKTRGVSGQFLNHLQLADALLIVARAFDDPSVPHVADRVDPVRDVETMLYELAFADIEILDRRIGRIAEGFKGAKTAEREALKQEQEAIARLKDNIESGTYIRDIGPSGDEARFTEGFGLLTAKPLIIVVNIGEGQLSKNPPPHEKLSRIVSGPRVRADSLCGKLEMELAQMEPDDEQEFRESMGVGESGLDRIIRLSYAVLDLITFFTASENEARAWPVTRDTTAAKAAGKIHTDLEKGFIRAETVSLDDLEQLGSIAEARRHGLLRQEGKTYMVKDADVINILFNV